MKALNVAVTGARGRIGQSLRSHFKKAKDIRIFPVSRSAGDGCYSYDDFFSYKFLNQIDVILHQAWSSVPKKSETNFGIEWNQDIPLLLRTLEAIKSGNHSHIHFIFFSSAGAIYSDGQRFAAGEDSPCRPANMYGWAKLHAEQLLQQFSNRFSLPVTLLRISNIYGIPSRKNDQQGIIPYLVKASLNEKKVIIWGDGTAKKDYLHISDFTTALTKVIRHKYLGILNICHGKSHTLNDIIRTIELITDKTIMCDYTEAFPWDNANVEVSNSTLKTELSWQPQVSLSQGIARIIDEVHQSLPSNKNQNL